MHLLSRKVLAALSLGLLILSCAVAASSERKAAPISDDLAERLAHQDKVRRAEYCATCHPEATAEHEMNTHGRAYSDPEVRLATGRFSIEGCIPCHTPRPTFETGMGMNPLKRLHHLEEANDCLSCHAREGADFSKFVGGKADCKAAFDERVGTVEACASCHRNHGTPYQWEHAAFGKKADNKCVDCHMPEVVRPVAVGEAPKKTRRHTFFASRSESQLHMAYRYDVKLDGNEAVVTIENAGAGHNFPTELKQRSVESVVVVRDVTGREIGRSRQVYRDPYKRPYGLTLPVNTQIPSGEKREHRVPLAAAAGTVETTLYYKLYYPIEDSHPDLTRILESRSMPFGPIEPSKKPIETAPEIHANLPEAIPVEAASPGNLADFARPKIASVPVEVPDGSKPGDIEKLTALFQFPVPQANRQAQDVLVKLGAKAVPAVMVALGSWDNKTWVQAQAVLIRMGAAVVPNLVAALDDPNLYTRVHAREIMARMGDLGASRPKAIEHLKKYLSAKNPVDRASAAECIGRIGAKDAAVAVRPLLEDLDYDTCSAAGRTLAMLGDKDAVPALRRAMQLRLRPIETARDLAWSLAALGDDSGIPVLLDGLAYPDDLVRESVFEAFLDVTGVSLGYTPLLPYEWRTTALAELRTWWVTKGGPQALRRPRSLEPNANQRAQIAKLVRDLGGNDMAPNDPKVSEESIAKLIQIGKLATPQICEGLKYPPGFADKRAGLLKVLGYIQDPESVPALIDAAQDPVLSVALWAVQALGAIGDPHGLQWVRRVEQRIDTLAETNRLPGSVGHPEDARVLTAIARQQLGDEGGTRLLMRLLFSGEPSARENAEKSLQIFETKRPNEPAVAAEVRELLATLPQKRDAIVGEMRNVWQGLLDVAEAAASKVQSRDDAFRALTRFDFAEEAVTRYAKLDPRAFNVDFRRTTLGADTVGARIYDDKALRDAMSERDLASIVERQGWAVSREGVACDFNNDEIHLSATADGTGGGASFGIGGPAGRTVPVEWWRDYEVSFEVSVVKQGFWILDRYDPIWAIFAETCLTEKPATRAGVLNPPIAEGHRYQMVHSVEGGDVVHRQREIGPDGKPLGDWFEMRMATPQNVRKGGFVLQLDPGADVVVRNLKLKVIRADAAEAYNTVVASKGR